MFGATGHLPELIIILVIAVLILGPGKLPQVGGAVGKTIREFRKASTDAEHEDAKEDAAAPVATSAKAADVEVHAPVSSAPSASVPSQKSEN